MLIKFPDVTDIYFILCCLHVFYNSRRLCIELYKLCLDLVPISSDGSDENENPIFHLFF